jgi:hypothetical protein
MGQIRHLKPPTWILERENENRKREGNIPNIDSKK